MATAIGHPKYHVKILREGRRACDRHPEIMGTVPWCLMDVRVPMHWRWYNRGSCTLAYGILDNDYNEKAAYAVVREEIATLKATHARASRRRAPAGAGSGTTASPCGSSAGQASPGRPT